MNCRLTSCLVLIILFIAANLGLAKAAVESNQGTVPGLQSKVFTFPQLNFKEGIRLRKTRGEYTLDFAFPTSWHAQSGTALVLNLSHSAALIPRLSNLSIEINDLPVKTITLDNQNFQPTDIVVPIDHVPLREYNHLTFRVGQHYAEDCEDDMSSCLWTRIGPTSRLVFVCKQDHLPLDLQNWPYPIVDVKTSYKEKVRFALPASPHQETLQAIARIAADLGNLSSFQEIELIDNTDTKCSTIIVGTPAENHAIEKLSSKLPLPVDKSGQFLDENGQPIPPDCGILELVNDDIGQVNLVVSGGTAAAVEKAAAALTNADVNPICGGKAAIVQTLALATSGENTPRPGQMPKETSFTLGQLGYTSSTVHGTCPDGISVSCNSRPGIEAVGSNQKLRIVFGYGAQINNELSALEVKLNGYSLRSYPLDKPAGEERHEDLISIPNYLINANNHFDFIFHLYPKQFSRCAPKNDEHLWGTLFEDTRLIIDREYVTNLPDLSLLNNSGFPFATDAALSNFLLVAPAQTGADAIKGIISLSMLFGQWTDNAESNLNVVFDNAIDQNMRSKSNLIILSPNDKNALQKELGTALALNNSDRFTKILNTSSGAKLTIKEAESNGYVEEIVSPWSKGKTILVLSGTSPSGFRMAVSGLTNSQLRYKLNGSLASVSAQGIVKYLQANQMVSYNSMTIWRQVTLWLSQSVWLGPLLLFVLLAFLIPRILSAIKPRES